VVDRERKAKWYGDLKVEQSGSKTSTMGLYADGNQKWVRRSGGGARYEVEARSILGKYGRRVRVGEVFWLLQPVSDEAPI
jgi:hypothetical protein